MADKTGIQWTNATWNPIAGCAVVSPGCTNCYAMREAGTRLVGQAKYAGLTDLSSAGPVWNGQVRFWETVLNQPIRWREPRLIFVNSMGDLFYRGSPDKWIGGIPDEWIDRIFAIMAVTLRHTYQVLTKRPDRMREYMTDPMTPHRIARIIPALPSSEAEKKAAAWKLESWPLPNVWLGTSVERQKEADIRIPDLLATPAAVRFISAEPLLGPIDLTNIDPTGIQRKTGAHGWSAIWKNNGIGRAWLDWVIVGGESGPSARPMHPGWARSIRDQCTAAGVAFFHKQNGEWLGYGAGALPDAAGNLGLPKAPTADFTFSDGTAVFRVGKDGAGRMLDGRTWDEYPAEAPQQ